MIHATVYYSGTFVNKPNSYTISFSEKDMAMERKNETTGRFERLTVGQIYDAFAKRSEYNTKATADESEEKLDHRIFEEWFKFKHLSNKSFKDRITNFTFHQTND